MKHPKYRVSDILFMDKAVLTDLLAVVRSWLPALDWSQSRKLQEFSQQYQVPIIPKLEMVGSYTFGDARLHSDLDFNLSWPNWDMQQAARMLYYSRNFRLAFGQIKEHWGNDNGFRVDVGCVDAKSLEYNIHLDCDSMLLHYRYDEDLPILSKGESTVEQIERVESYLPIDIMAFDPATDTPPPVHNIHLRLDNYSFRWVPYPNPYKELSSQFSEDEFASEQEPWKTLYGERYTGYIQANGNLVEV